MLNGNTSEKRATKSTKTTYSNIFYLNTTLIKINHNLSVKFFRQQNKESNFSEEIKNFVYKKYKQ